ncbi:MAG: ABC transporter permease [Anaerolineales bacterium]|nr:ABC transporter permease [Anaerolineales bacterium]
MQKLRMNLRLFLQGAFFSYVALFRWLRPATYMASKVIMPLNQILFFSFLGMFATGSDDPSFFVIGNAIQLTAISGIYGVTMSVGGDRWEGTLAYLFGTPANRMALFVGRAFFHVVDGMLGVFLGLMWGILLLGLDVSQTNPVALVLTILVTTVSTSGLGLLMGCLSLITRNIFFINNTVYFLLLIFSGANIPLSSLPSPMRALSDFLPLTRGIEAARAIFAGGQLADVIPLLSGEIILGAVYIALGYSLFRGFEFQAKRRGTLEAM